MNITGSLVELPYWDDYYEPKEGISDDLDSQAMANHFIPETVHSSCPSAPENTSLIPLSRAELIHNTALQSKAIRALYERAVASPTWFCSSGPWPIRFESRVEFRAHCALFSREIVIRSNVSNDEAIFLYVFELTNAIANNKHLDLLWQILFGTIGCEEYTKQTEFIEFEGMQLHHKVMQEAIKEMNWSNEMDRYQSYASMDFTTYWELIKNTPHANYYRNAWKKNYIIKKIATGILLVGLLYRSPQIYNYFSSKILSRT